MSILACIFGWIFREFTGNSEDKYIEVNPAVTKHSVVPFARTDVPDLGNDHASLVARAELLYEDDGLRYKWLMSIHRLRTETKTGWILKPKDPDNPTKPAWGLKSTGP